MKQKLLLLALLAQFCSLTTMAYDAYIDGIYYEFSGLNATVVSGDVPYSGSIVIPSSINYNGKNYVVTKIGDSAFISCTISSIVIPSSVSTIDDQAFLGCACSTYIDLPNSINAIGYRAFNECYSLNSVPENLTRIGLYAFDGTSWYSRNPQGLVYAGKVAYKYKGTMPENTTIEIKDGTLSIAFAFNGCSGLTSIIIPESVTTIADGAFNGTAWFENQPDGLVYAGKVAYKYKGTMPENTTIEIKEGTLAIADNAFGYCTNLSSITLPEGLTTIGFSAFQCCRNLMSINIPESVISIGDNAFSGCTAITSITIPQDVTTISDYLFHECYRLSSINITKGVTSIGAGAFSGTGITTLTIPESVVSIGNNAFLGCTQLTSIVVEEGNTMYDSRDNCNALIETATNTLMVGCGNTVIPKSITSIGNSAFFGCGNLTTLIIPESVKNIGLNAFLGCNFLTSIVVEEGNSIYDSRDNCNALIETATNTLMLGCKNTTIPESVTSIEDGAFSRCNGLASITIPGNVISIGDGAFYYCFDLASITIPESVTTIGYEAFEGTRWFDNQPDGLIYADKIAYKYKGTMPENTSIELRDGTLGIADGAFSNCSGLVSITIPESVTNIGASAFYYCNNLTSVNISIGVTTIGDWAFGHCENLTSISIPEGVTTIGYSAFCYCYDLTSITLPEGLISIGGSAFGGCTSLTSVILPEGLISIGGSAFSGCSSLTSITIPKSVSKIDNFAFSGCDNICLVKSEMRDPVPVSIRTFDHNYLQTLYVPRGSKEAYQTADVWKDFKEIIECDYVDVTDQTIAVGGSTTMEINVNNFDNDLVAFQMDLILPEGISLDKTGCSLSSRITDEEQELTIGKLENGAYRLTSSSLSLTPISGNDGTLITLKLTAEEGSIGGQATISNIRFSTSNSNRLTMDDETFDINVMYKVIYIVDGEEYKTVNVLYNTPITPETELTKEGYTFSGWSEIPEIMPAHNVEVTGTFTINKYKLTYIVDDIEYKSYEIDYATVITPEAEPTQGGHNFSGWSEIPETMPAHDVEVYGTFSHTLTYLVDGEPYKISSVVYGSDLTLEDEPTKDGYTFGGWSELPETMPAHDVKVTGRFYLFGDVNTDEEVDVVDVVDVARFVVATPSEKFREKLADLNFDNTVNLGDAVVLVNHIAGDQNFVREMFASERSTNTGVLSLTRNGKTLALNLTNGQAYTAFQFDLYVAEDADITLMMLNGQRKQKHQLLYNKVEDGHYRVAALSTSNNEFNGNEGELLNITMNGVSGDEVSVRNIHFFDVKGNDYLFDDIEGSVATSIENIEHSTLNIEQPIYNAAGLRLNKMQKGINIVGDKKVVVK